MLTSRPRALPLLTAATIALSACSGEAETSNAEDPAPVAAAAGAEPTSAPVPTTETPGTPGIPDEVMDEVRRAAAAAENEGSAECERAYLAAAASVRVLANHFPGMAQVPPRDSFVAACEVLPAAARRCMVMAYLLEHREACEQANNALDPDTQARVQQLLLKGASTARSAGTP